MLSIKIETLFSFIVVNFLDSMNSIHPKSKGSFLQMCLDNHLHFSNHNVPTIINLMITTCYKLCFVIYKRAITKLNNFTCTCTCNCKDECICKCQWNCNYNCKCNCNYNCNFNFNRNCNFIKELVS